MQLNNLIGTLVELKAALYSLLPAKLIKFNYPKTILLEPTNYCNLKCPLCPTTHSMTREKGTLTYEMAKKIIDSFPSSVKHVMMNGSGETLICKDIFKIIDYMYKKGIKTEIGTNCTIERSDELLKSKVDKVYLALDGMTKESYEHYRVGANFEQVKNNIEMLCKKKCELGLKKPNIALQMVIFKQNENQIEELIKYGKKLKVNEIILKKAGLGNEQLDLSRKELAKKYLPKNKRYWRYKKQGIFGIKPRFCNHLFQSTVLWNGNVVLCCYDVNGDLILGNVLKDGGFKRIWGSEKYKGIRKLVMKKQLEMCKKCDYVPNLGFTIKLN